MMLEALKPGTLEGPNGDDVYLGRVMKYGDTTTPRAQIKALESFGQRAEFCMNGSWDDVRKLLDQGIPVPMGILHQGHVEKPVGGATGSQRSATTRSRWWCMIRSEIST